MAVVLEHGSRAAGRDRALDGFRDGGRLALTGGQQKQVAGPGDGAETLGEHVVGHRVGDPKKRALSRLVVAVRVLIRVSDASEEPGSLKAR